MARASEHETPLESPRAASQGPAAGCKPLGESRGSTLLEARHDDTLELQHDAPLASDASVRQLALQGTSQALPLAWQLASQLASPRAPQWASQRALSRPSHCEAQRDTVASFEPPRLRSQIVPYTDALEARRDNMLEPQHSALLASSTDTWISPRQRAALRATEVASSRASQLLASPRTPQQPARQSASIVAPPVALQVAPQVASHVASQTPQSTPQLAAPKLAPRASQTPARVPSALVLPCAAPQLAPPLLPQLAPRSSLQLEPQLGEVEYAMSLATTLCPMQLAPGRASPRTTPRSTPMHPAPQQQPLRRVPMATATRSTPVTPQCMAPQLASPHLVSLAKFKAWRELTRSERAEASLLGYDAVTWQTGDIVRSWAELSAQERRAAVYLGYAPHDWDEELALTTRCSIAGHRSRGLGSRTRRQERRACERSVPLRSQEPLAARGPSAQRPQRRPPRCAR